MSVARAFKAVVSLSSSGVLISPCVCKIFWVLGLSMTDFRIAAFLIGVPGSAGRTLSVARFFDVLFLKLGSDVEGISCPSSACRFFSARCFLTLSFVRFLIFFFPGL